MSACQIFAVAVCELFAFMFVVIHEKDAPLDIRLLLAIVSIFSFYVGYMLNA